MEGLTNLMGSLQGKRRKRTLDHDHIWEIADADLDENKDSSVEDVLWNMLKDDATERRRKHLARPDLRRLEKKRELQGTTERPSTYKRLGTTKRPSTYKRK